MILKKFNYISGPKLADMEVKEINGKRHYISPEGNIYPSLTTVLSSFKEKSLEDWRNRVGHDKAKRITTKASNRGTRFHKLMEDYIKNDPNCLSGIMPDMLQSFRQIQSHIDKIDNIKHIECPLYSDILKVAGRTDLIAEWCGQPAIIDFKTSKKEKKESWIENYFEQGTGYSYMYEERTDIKIPTIVLIISVDGMIEPQIFVKNRKNYRDSLMEKIKIYRKENPNVY